MRLARIPVLVLAGLLPSCGGGDSPARPSAPQAQVQTTLTVVAGETASAVAGASVTVAGQAFTTDASGRITLPDRPATGAFIDVVAGGFLDRQTLFRSGTAELSLWPRRAAQGFDEAFTARVVYTSASDEDPVVGDSPLSRLRAGISMATIVAAPEILADAAALRSLEDAAGQVGVATGGAIAYQVASARPASGTFFEARIDPTDALCSEARGYFRGRSIGDELTGGAIVFCSVAIARTSTAAHEVGHSLGLQHSNQLPDLMYPSFQRARATSLTPREGMAVRLMLERRGGNRFPDNDRSVSVSGAARTRVTICE